MKKILSLMLALLLLFANLLVSCDSGSDSGDSSGGDDAQPKSLMEITSDYVVTYNTFNIGEKIAVSDFIATFSEKYGIELAKKDHTKGKNNFEIQIGSLDTRDEYLAAKEKMDTYSTEGLGVALVRVSGSTLGIFGSNNDAIEVAIDYLFNNLFEDGARIDKNTDTMIMFDVFKYRSNGELVGYSLDDISSFSDACAFYVNDKSLDGFSPDVKEYNFNVSFVEGYPKISVSPLCKDATVRYDRPSAENNGIATVTITSADGKNVSVYKLNVDMNNTYSVSAEVVNKGGAAGVVSFVIDDGDKETATFMKDKMFVKYDNLCASFAVMTKDLATLKTELDVNDIPQYVMTDDGKYTYTANLDNLKFWQDILATGRAEILSHSHTHRYWGDDDNGGVFTYTKNDGTVAQSEYFPKGNVTKELAASAQIIEELLGERAYGYIKPGVGAKLSKYYYDLVISSDIYIAARTTSNSPENPISMVNYVENFEDISKRFSVKAYMVEHYNVSPYKDTDETSSPSDCLKYGIEYWTNYIDKAAETEGFACFCIHNIRGDTHTGSGHFIYQSQADALFGYVNERDDLWIATFEDAMLYYNEWSTATVSATAYRDEKITVTLSDSENDEIYNMPLTVKVEVPDTWVKAVATQGQRVETLPIYTDDDGVCFVYVDIVPDSDDMILTPSNK